MFKFLRKLWNDKRGNALIIAGAALPMIVGAAGLANDTIQWTLWKRQLQRAADSAAIAGVYQRQDGANDDATTAAVTHDLSRNLHTFYGLKSGFPVVAFPADTGVETDQVHVTLAIQQRLPFSSMFMGTAPTITVNATAASIPAGGDACIEALETAATTGVTFSGNASIEMPDCDIFSNSAGTNSAIARGSSAVTANSVGGVGGIQQSNNFDVTSYRPYSPALSDPFADVDPDPAGMHCAGHMETHGHSTTWVNDVLTEATNMAAARDADGNPANCWASMSVGSNTTLNVPDNFGPIYLNGGGARIQGNLSCESCTIVLTNSNPASSTIGQITVNAGTNLNISAPTDGDFQGIAIFQDRRAGSCTTGACNKINGNSASIITGALYFPNQLIDYNGTGTTTATCTMFVARRITFSGNSGTSNKFKSLADCSAEGLPSNVTTRMVRLVA